MAKTTRSQVTEWLNQNVHAIRRETLEAKTHVILTAYPPPAVGGPVMRVDPFHRMFDAVYLMSMVPHIVDVLDKTIGVLRNPLPIVEARSDPPVKAEVQAGYAFVAMPMDRDNHQLVDVLEAIDPRRSAQLPPDIASRF